MTRKVRDGLGLTITPDNEHRADSPVNIHQIVIQQGVPANSPEDLHCSRISKYQQPPKSPIQFYDWKLCPGRSFPVSQNSLPLPLCVERSSDTSPLRPDPGFQGEMEVMSTAFNVNSPPPFKSPMETLGVQQYDVLKIKNVPYAVSISEIKSFVARLTPSPLILDHIQGFSVHIIMERSTAKTMECYVEFQNHGAAKAAIERAENSVFLNKPLKMGSRHIDLELSSEGELCAALFPRAKSIKWDSKTGVPSIEENNDPYSDGFAGFFTIEEITNVCKHAANPQKSTFSQRCQQRVYESMISTLYKFPWHVPASYSVNARDFLWSSYMQMLRILVTRVKPSGGLVAPASSHRSVDREVGLGHTLLMDFLFAGLNTPIFSLRQKFAIALESYPLGPGFGVPGQAVAWPFATLVPEKSVHSGVIDDWIRILDIGYQKLAFSKFPYKHAELAQITRDDAGYLAVELSDRGKKLSVNQLIKLEQELMEVLVEEGRSEWCQANNALYEPLYILRCQWAEPDAFQSSTNSDDIPSGDNGPSTRGPDGLELVVSDGPDQATDVNQEQDNMVNAIGGMTLSETAIGSLNERSHFDPATPSFTPFQPWIGTGNMQNGHGAAHAATTQQPRNVSLRQSLPPTNTWTTNQENPVPNQYNTWHVPLPTPQQQDPWYGNHSYDPFSSNVTPPSGPRRSSLPSSRRTSPSPGIQQGAPGHFANNGGYSQNDYGGGRAVSGSSLPAPPTYGNIWGPAYTGGPPMSGTPRRSASAESTSSNADAEYGYGSGHNTPLQSNTPRIDSTTPSVPLHEGMSTPNHGYALTSPGRGGRSRSSLGHKSVHIQATIDEEGDMSAGEATAAGGVSL